VAVDGDGVVRGRGVANSLEQVEELMDEARALATAPVGHDHDHDGGPRARNGHEPRGGG
jgi:hypothetical protein